jgi:type II restriction enzyme
MASSPIHDLISKWRDDAGGTYRTWFLWDERLKNFRSIRRGLQKVVAEIESETFGSAYRGSSLEAVVGAIAEQRQIFKGADHAFLWKPKLRVPDIYEDKENQLAFGRFLGECLCCGAEDALIASVRRLSDRKIKGLGPAAANLLYFLHPTLAMPFNTAIVNGYNGLAGAKVKLGSWDEYLALRTGALRLVAEHRDVLSNDLGAVAGFLYDIGAGRWQAPPRLDDAAALAAWEADLAKAREESAKERKAREAERAGEVTHTEVQGWLRDLGRQLGYEVWVAANDRNRPLGTGSLKDGCLESLPDPLASESGAEFIPLIDVLWLDRASLRVEAAFEVEHTTTIQTGIMRMLDLAETQTGGLDGLYLVAPDDREEEVRRQLQRPAFRRIGDLKVLWLPYGELQKNREAMGRFGEGLKALNAVARPIG